MCNNPEEIKVIDTYADQIKQIKALAKAHNLKFVLVKAKTYRGDKGFLLTARDSHDRKVDLFGDAEFISKILQKEH